MAEKPALTYTKTKEDGSKEKIEVKIPKTVKRVLRGGPHDGMTVAIPVDDEGSLTVDEVRVGDEAYGPNHDDVWVRVPK